MRHAFAAFYLGDALLLCAAGCESEPRKPEINEDSKTAIEATGEDSFKAKGELLLQFRTGYDTYVLLKPLAEAKIISGWTLEPSRSFEVEWRDASVAVVDHSVQQGNQKVTSKAYRITVALRLRLRVRPPQEGIGETLIATFPKAQEICDDVDCTSRIPTARFHVEWFPSNKARGLHRLGGDVAAILAATAALLIGGFFCSDKIRFAGAVKKAAAFAALGGACGVAVYSFFTVRDTWWILWSRDNLTLLAPWVGLHIGDILAIGAISLGRRLSRRLAVSTMVAAAVAGGLACLFLYRSGMRPGLHLARDLDGVSGWELVVAATVVLAILALAGIGLRRSPWLERVRRTLLVGLCALVLGIGIAATCELQSLSWGDSHGWLWPVVHPLPNAIAVLTAGEGMLASLLLLEGLWGAVRLLWSLIFSPRCVGCGTWTWLPTMVKTARTCPKCGSALPGRNPPWVVGLALMGAPLALAVWPWIRSTDGLRRRAVEIEPEPTTYREEAHETSPS